MPSYTYEISPAAARQIRKLARPVQERIAVRLRRLMEDPRPKDALKLAGQEGLYRIRVGDYRIVYRIVDDALLVVIVRVGHRGEVYSRL